jgi:hypothetical protein
MPGEPSKKSAKSQLVENSSCKLIRLAYWRRRVISANIIGFGEVEEALQKISNASPIRLLNEL